MQKINSEKINYSYEILKQIHQLINEKKYDEAVKLLNKLKNEDENKVSYIRKFIAEEEYYNSIKETERGYKISKYLKSGKEALDKEKYQIALKIFSNGYKNTLDLIFYYYIGVCLAKLGNYKDAIQYLEIYKKHGFIKLDKCLHRLQKIYKELSIKYDDKELYEEKISDCVSKERTIKQLQYFDFYAVGIDKLNEIKLNTNDKEVEELIKNSKFDEISILYDQSDYKRKITILAVLYNNGLDKFADNLLKNYKEELQENCKEDYNKLKKYKQILKMNPKK